MISHLFSHSHGIAQVIPFFFAIYKIDSRKEFNVDQAMLSQMQNAGMHPLKVAGVDTI